MIAQFPGLCVNCDQDINVGDDLRREDGAWVHTDCPFPPIKTKQCTKCFTYAALDGSCLCE